MKSKKLKWIPARKFEIGIPYMAGGYQGTTLFWCIDDDRLVIYDETRNMYAITEPTANDRELWQKEMQEYAGKEKQ